MRCCCCEQQSYALNRVTGRFLLVPFIPGDLALRAAQHAKPRLSCWLSARVAELVASGCAPSMWDFIYFSQYYVELFVQREFTSSNLATVKWYRNWNRRRKVPTIFIDFSSFYFCALTIWNQNFIFLFASSWIYGFGRSFIDLFSSQNLESPMSHI